MPAALAPAASGGGPPRLCSSHALSTAMSDLAQRRHVGARLLVEELAQVEQPSLRRFQFSVHDLAVAHKALPHVSGGRIDEADVAAFQDLQRLGDSPGV